MYRTLLLATVLTTFTLGVSVSAISLHDPTGEGRAAFEKIAVYNRCLLYTSFGGTPEGLKPQVWQLFGIYLATIVGLVLKPFPVPITVLLGVATSSILLSNTKDVLAGYSNTALWLIFAAFALSVAFGKTGLGHRIAYYLVRAFGSTTPVSYTHLDVYKRQM